RDSTKSFGRHETLKSVELSLESGEFLVLLGASGCGKSTLLNIIAGLLDPTAGKVEIAGRDVTRIAPKDRDIAMVFQSYALYPSLSVARNIGFGLEMRGASKSDRQAAVARAAEILQISHLLDRKPAALSGGQRQRVAIGRALVREPKLFLFDEPLSNLDAKLRMEMRSELKRLHQMLAATIVYVTHDQIEAMTLASRIAVMRDGRIEQLGTPDEIYNRPATTFVAEFVGSPPMNLIPATLEAGALRLDGVVDALPLPDGIETGPESGRILLGIRPEALCLTAEGPVPVEVELVEFTGPEQIVTVACAGQKLTAILPPGQRFAPGARGALQWPLEQLHLFDAETGCRL
ncbi:ABC transporter ATP-binding protein, partial [Thioclava sp. BHET1]